MLGNSLNPSEVMARFDGGMAGSVCPTPRAEVDAILARHYGLAGALQPFAAERDEIFGVRTAEGQRFVLKIHNPLEKSALADLRLQAMKHVERVDPTLPVPRIITSGDGDAPVVHISDGSERIVHLMTFLDGMPQHTLPRSPRQAFNIGAKLARMAVALSDFAHVADERYLAWDLANAADLLALLPHDASGRWNFVARTLHRFEDETRHRLAMLPRQVVHNDFNAHNLLMGANEPERVIGVLDFGDVARTQRVSDLAIAACYQLRFDESGLAGATDVVAGYLSENALRDEETDILFDLMAVRLSIAVAITKWRAALNPDRAEAILKNTGYAWRGLDRLAGIDRATTTGMLCSTRKGGSPK